ncbi:Protein kinase, catalytic domain-containing protein [Rozella allomycis CSF55]|uniref:non-specific serine/threonine protein kinase n=1 Tax=Rozella allomycis (strain CSF55) TaxID=988480 RepID=A0A075ARE5_ROZAC|nr:Protein kinase, catalytic domain-containing protein [Rozella allomycis CSF55]|eukprot:EPZ32745.1 Protein kinase, catalytic domain-containing protein [Rozella allomycis CSF55]
MPERSTLYEKYFNSSSNTIKKILNNELIAMTKEDLHKYFDYQKYCRKSEDARAVDLERLALIDRIYNKEEFDNINKTKANQNLNECPDDNKKRIGQYMLIKTLGQGTFAKVKLAEDVNTKQKFAIKIIDKKGIKGQKSSISIKRELHLLKYLRHPHIARSFEIFETANEHYIVQEYASGGELFDYIVQKSKLDERESRHLFRQIISAVDYCHQNSVIHRDLKPENLLLDEKGNIKIIDFGFGNTYHIDQLLHTFCGSPYYAAPEMIKGVSYTGPEVDIWSLGVILYAMLTGTLPFDGKDLSQLYERIQSGKFKQPQENSAEARDLLQKMLNVNPFQRITMQGIKNHPWILQNYGKPPPDYMHQRPNIVKRPNLNCIAVLKNIGFSEEEVLKTIQKDIGRHPISSLYFLAEEASIPIPEICDPESPETSLNSNLSNDLMHMNISGSEQKILEQSSKRKKSSGKKFFLFNNDPKSNEDISLNEKTDTEFIQENKKDTKGFFNITTLSYKAIPEIEREIERILINHEFSYTRKDKNYVAQRTDKIQIVPVDSKQHAVHFKRLKGSLWYHKKLAGRLIQEMSL